MLFRKIFLLLLFSTLGISLYAQKNDTIYHRYNPNWTKTFIPFSDSIYALDTTLHGFQYYNLLDQYSGYQNLGNLGMAAYPLLFPVQQTVGFDAGFHQFDPYLYSPDRDYYNTHKPYTLLYYVIGSKNEQLFEGTHTQNINPYWNIGIDIRRLGSDGFYLRQRSDVFDISLFTSFQSRNNKWEIYSNAFYNKIKARENGGITADAPFTDPNYSTKELVPIQYDTATTHWNVKGISFLIMRSFGQSYTRKINDSTKVQAIVPSFKIYYRFLVDHSNYMFYDNFQDQTMYRNFYFNNSLTEDSIEYLQFQHEAGIQLTDLKSRIHDTLHYNPFLLKAYFKYIYTYVYIPTQIITNSIAGFDLQNSNHIRLSRNLFYHFNGEYNFLGTNKGEFTLNATASGQVKSFLIEANIGSSQKDPTLVQNSLFYNNFYWKNNFSPTKISFAGAGIILIPGIKVNAQIYNVRNYIYWAEDLQPHQYSGTFQGIHAWIEEKNRIGKFYFKNEIHYQVFSPSAPVSLPQWYTLHSIYLENDFFKHALKTQFGVDAQFNSDFYAPQYIPETGQFFLQTFAKQSYYPVLDAFINFKIRSARFFFLLTNADQNIFMPGYYQAYQYPAPDLSIHAGISWMLWN
jgi:hypothetical protein